METYLEGYLTPEEWLEQTGKWPWRPDDSGYKFWYWATEIGYNGPHPPEELEEDAHFIVPVPVWDKLMEKTTYPYVKMYRTEAEALEDFRQAFAKAVQEGWTGGR